MAVAEGWEVLLRWICEAKESAVPDTAGHSLEAVSVDHVGDVGCSELSF